METAWRNWYDAEAGTVERKVFGYGYKVASPKDWVRQGSLLPRSERQTSRHADRGQPADG